MRPKNSLYEQYPSRRSFIEEKRRDQIIDATIALVAKSGYFAATFANIAAEAGINQGLISYHFKNKDELLREVFQAVLNERFSLLRKAVDAQQSAPNQLKAFIITDLRYVEEHPDRFKAAGEVLFSLRSADGTINYASGELDPILSLLEDIVKRGQAAGNFGKGNVRDMMIAISGAKDTYAAMFAAGLDVGLNMTRFARAMTKMALTITNKENE